MPNRDDENLSEIRNLLLRRNMLLMLMSFLSLYFFSNTRGWISEISAGVAAISICALLKQFERLVEVTLDIEDRGN